MRHKTGDVVRIITNRTKTPTGDIPTMIHPYVGNEAVIEHVDEERKFYRIRLLVPLSRGLIRFNVTDRMIEPEVTEAMLAAAEKASDALESDSWNDRHTVIYQAMRGARFKGAA